MITPYVRPQDTITQILQQTAVRATSRRNPVVIGPQYDLYLNDGRDLTGAYRAFSNTGLTGALYTDENGVALDLNRVTPQTAGAVLYGDQLEALVASLGSGVMTLDLLDPTSRTIRIAANNLAGVGVLNAGLDGRAVRVGDSVALGWSTTLPSASGTTRRKVVGLAGKVTAASVAGNATNAVSPLNPTTTASTTATAVAAATTVGLSIGTAPVLAAADIDLLRAAGKILLVGTAYKLADQLEIVCVTGGAPTVATFAVTSLATGLTATVTSSGTAPNFTISLAALGYGGTAAVTIARTGNMVSGERIRVMLQPLFTPAATGFIPVAGTYTPTVDRRYAIEVVATTGSTEYDIKVYDVTGVDPEVTYTGVVASGALALGTSGLTINPAGSAAGVCKGFIWYVDVVAAKISGTEFTGLVLDGPAVPTVSVAASVAGGGVITLTSTAIHQVFSGALNDTNTPGIDPIIVAGATTWAYATGIGLSSTAAGRTSAAFSPFATAFGSVYLTFKALVKPIANEGVIEINREVDLPDDVGETSTENWLGRGALEAFRGNQNRVVYALRTGGDTVEDFRVALRKIQTTDRVYALVGLTDNFDVMTLVRDHCNTMSNKFNKNFRRAYFGTDSPGAYVYWGVLPGGGYRTGDLASSIVTLAAGFRSTSKFTNADVGSTITVQSIGQTYTILERLSDFEVLTNAPNVLTATGSNLILTRSDTPANAALFVSDRSVALGSRRAVNVWCDDPTITEGGVSKVLPMKFVAAEIAGLRCALLPQQGLTMTELKSVQSAPSMYTAYDPEDLDAVAAAGTFIIVQESEGGDVFIRHQLTTGTDEGALAYEDNVGVIVDEFSYAVKDSFRSYIGRRNATPDTIAEIDDKLKALATDFTQVELVNRDVGPAVLAFFDEKGNEGEVTVRQDGDLADTLMTYVKLRVPLPLNGLNHYIDVEVAELLASEDN